MDRDSANVVDTLLTIAQNQPDPTTRRLIQQLAEAYQRDASRGRDLVQSTLGIIALQMISTVYDAIGSKLPHELPDFEEQRAFVQTSINTLVDLNRTVIRAFTSLEDRDTQETVLRRIENEHVIWLIRWGLVGLALDILLHAAVVIILLLQALR